MPKRQRGRRRMDEPTPAPVDMTCGLCGRRIAKGSQLVYLNTYYPHRAESVATHEGCARRVAGAEG
jgi:hypothetical protein